MSVRETTIQAVRFYITAKRKRLIKSHVDFFVKMGLWVAISAHKPYSDPAIKKSKKPGAQTGQVAKPELARVDRLACACEDLETATESKAQLQAPAVISDSPSKEKLPAALASSPVPAESKGQRDPLKSEPEKLDESYQVKPEPAETD